MTPQRWASIKEVFGEALEKPAAERSAFLDSACGSDVELRAEVERLLAASDEPSVQSPACGFVNAAARELSPGDTVAHYRIEARLGDGGMGVVYKAHDTSLNRSVAIKVLRFADLGGEESVRRFTQEARAASALNHPNIVTIHQISTHDGAPFIVMEHVPGKSLDQLIPRHGMRLGEVLKIGAQVAGALAAAAAAGVVHRDVKPGNVMVTDSGIVKVVDFGLAKQARRADYESTQTETGAIVGTVSYMSPEQAEGKPVDPRSDIFSFGAVLYEMATGQRAFRGETTMSTLSAILRDEPKPVSQISAEIPRDLEKIITRCLRKDAERRFQYMADVRVALLELKEESESGTPNDMPPMPPRRRRLVPWIVAAAAAAGLGFWYFVVANRGGEAPMKVVPLTTYAGIQRDPSFSPDGSQVAFSWNGEDQDNNDIYVKLIGPGLPLRLTTTRAKEYAPEWSPDGRYIAFLRELEHGSHAVVVMPALGGPERILGEVAHALGAVQGNKHLSWSPDGKWLAATDCLPARPAIVVLLSIETGEKRKLTSPPATYTTGDSSPAFSPDGRTLAFSRSVQNSNSDLYKLELSKDYMPKGEPKRLTFHQGFVPSSAWTADGREIVYSTGQGTNVTLWRVLASGSGKPTQLPFVGEGALSPAVSRQNNRLAFVRARGNVNIWRVEVPGGVPPKPGSLPASVKLISSTRSQTTPALSPDGSKIAFSSNRSGTWEIWVCDRNGANAGPLTALNGAVAANPKWSPDGTRIVFDAPSEEHVQIFEMNSQGGQPRRITGSPANDVEPNWSRDGQWIYFSSNRSGEKQVWKIRASNSQGEQAIQVTRNGGAYPAESPDGKFIYYLKGDLYLWRMPVEGGDENRVLGRVNRDHFAVLARGIYFNGWLDSPKSYWIQYYDLATGKVTPVAAISKMPSFGFSASQNGTFILYPQVDQGSSELMLVEDFR